MPGNFAQEVREQIETQVEVQAKYAGYIERQEREIAKHAKQESLRLPEDLDYAEAISRFNQQLTALQASQQAFLRVQDLSLFNYL